MMNRYRIDLNIPIKMSEMGTLTRSRCKHISYGGSLSIIVVYENAIQKSHDKLVDFSKFNIVYISIKKCEM